MGKGYREFGVTELCDWHALLGYLGFSEQPVVLRWADIKMMKSRRILTVDRRNCGICPVYPASRAHFAREREQSPACQPQVGQRKQRHDLASDRHGQIMLLQKMPETQDGAFVRHAVFECVQAGELPQQRDIVQCFFHRWVGIAELLLHEVNVQDRPPWHRRSAVALLWVERFNQRLQARPRYDRVHLRQEYRFPGLLPSFRQESRLGQAQLPHRFHQFNGRYVNGAIFSNYVE